MEDRIKVVNLNSLLSTLELAQSEPLSKLVDRAWILPENRDPIQCLVLII